VAGASVAEAVVTVIMLEKAAMVQMITEAAGDPAPEFPRADIEKLRADITMPDQFAVNFDYLVRRVERRTQAQA
jgi:L-fuculose-phosphate aldolase